MITVGVDTGGTFTDFVFLDPQGNIIVDKRPSYPKDPARPALEGLESVRMEKMARIIHGTTVATNALLEGKTGAAALITTAGFEDVLEIGRQNRPSLYALNPQKEKPLIHKGLRFGVHERILVDGSIQRPLKREEVREVLERIKDTAADALAVCLLHSYINDSHERVIGEMARNMGFIVSLSCETLPEFREYERTCAVALNAALQPVMRGYLDRLKGGLETSKLSVMQSSGGIMPASMAAQLPLHTALSGPAGGVIAAAQTARRAGFEKIISFDMGGTSTDVSVYAGKPELSVEKSISGVPIRVPVLDIHTVAAGGGSIARLDAGGSLKVGPHSAGAFPGPICYGLGGDQVTVTDAHLFLGRIQSGSFLGGRMDLDTGSATRGIEKLASSLGKSPEAAAMGVIEVANAVMERAIRVITVQRGHDPREFTLVSFGGAGGLHAVELARGLGIPRVIIPKNPGVFSAYGMVIADTTRDLSKTILKDADSVNFLELNAIFEKLILSGAKELEIAGIDPESIRSQRTMDLRYKGQSFEINVPFSEGFREEFHNAHERLYGFCKRQELIEVVTLRVRLSSPTATGSEKENWSVFEASRSVENKRNPKTDGALRVINRDHLKENDIIEGPCVIMEANATTWAPEGCSGVVDRSGQIILSTMSINS